MNGQVIPNEAEEVFSGDNLTGPAYVERRIKWPGGRGMFHVDMTPSGPSAKIDVAWVGMPAEYDAGNSGWYMNPSALSLGGTSSISASGSHLVDLPRCFITFMVQLSAGDTLSIGQATLVRM